MTHNYSEDFLLSADFEALLEEGRECLGRLHKDPDSRVRDFDHLEMWLLDLRLKRTMAAEKAQARDEADHGTGKRDAAQVRVIGEFMAEEEKE